MTAKPGLLDINVLIALLDPAHEHHEAAHSWFRSHRRRGWATCPITENGCLRIMSNPAYPFPGLTVERVRGILAQLVRVEGHLFWPDSLSLLGAGGHDLAAVAPKHVTDIYLVSLAAANAGRLITFDRTIPLHAIAGSAPEAIEVLS